MKILIYNSGGGLGDSIQLFDLITTLKEKFGASNLYYLSAHKDHFNGALKDYNIQLKLLKTNIIYFGFRFWHLLMSKKKILRNNSIDEFDLIIDLQSKLRNTLILKQFPTKHFYSSTFNFKFCSLKKDFQSTKNEIKNIILNLEKLLETEIPFKKYSLDKIDKKYFLEAKKLLPNENYIGFSITQGNEYRNKSWSFKSFVNIAKKIKSKGKIPVFFIEKNNTDLKNKINSLVPKALFPEHQSNISCPALVTALSTRLDLGISIDNGVMHMMSLANIPMIVLFGPTDPEKFAPKINSIRILDSKEIYKTKNIDTITVHDVYKLI